MKDLPSTTRQNAMIGYQISRLKLDSDTKEEMIWLHSNGRTTKISELLFEEAKLVIAALMSGQVVYVKPKTKMIRKILSQAHEMNWELQDGAVDMSRVNNWCVKYGYLGKPLDEYSEAELPDLVTAFEKMYLKYIKG